MLCGTQHVLVGGGMRPPNNKHEGDTLTTNTIHAEMRKLAVLLSQNRILNRKKKKVGKLRIGYQSYEKKSYSVKCGEG